MAWSGATKPSPLERQPGERVPVILPPLSADQWAEIKRRVLIDAADAADAQARVVAYGSREQGRPSWDQLAAIGLWLRDYADDI